MAPKSGGYVYILTNPKIPGLVKIGSTKLSPDERARQLPTTGVPAPFQVVGCHWFEDELRIERELQAMFSRQRVHPRREFYETTIDAAQQAVLHLSNGRHHEPARASGAADETTANNAILGPQSRPASNTNASVLGLPYWTRFNKFRAERNLLPRFETAGPRFFHRYFLVRPSGQNRKRNIHYEGRIRINSPQTSMRGKDRIAHGCRFLSAAAALERSRGHYHPAGVSGAGDRQSRLRPRSLSGLKDLIADADALSGGKNCG